MGLDMYLYARKRIGNDEEIDRMLATLDLQREDISPHFPSIYIEIEIAYWRKVNAIHGWFVDNVQDGVDECQETEVGRSQLTELRDLCIGVREAWLRGDKTVAVHELPPRDGFFFGSTDVDEDYLEDLSDTIDQLTRVLDNPRLEDYYFVYRASW